MMESVQIGRTFALSILAGLIAGGILAAMNLTVVRPATSLLTDAVLDQLIADAEYDEEQFESKVQSIYFSQTAGAAATGLGGGALIGAICLLGKRNTGHISFAILIAGLAWFVLYAVPAAKFPPSPLALFKDDAASQYYRLYFAYVALSGLAALGIVLAFRRITIKNKIFGMAALYFLIIAVAFFVFPNYDLDSAFDQQVVSYWRTAVSAAMAVFWFSAGAIAGLLWKYGSTKDKV